MGSWRYQEHRIEPGKPVSLAALATDDKGPFSGKDDPEVERLRARDTARLSQLQEKLFAEGQRAILVVLQAMDTGGKDGVLRHVVGPLDSRGVQVRSFGVPSREELNHDYLWRIHQHAPPRGQMVFFNRSHYEDVVAVRVEKLAAREVWEKRYRQINEFERTLVECGTSVVKLFLHISRDEQKQRLEERLRDPDKRWKFNPADLDARSRWDDYQEAYEDAISRCSTEWAPWWVVPAGRKWYRDITVGRILASVLAELDPKYPERDIDYDAIKIPD